MNRAIFGIVICVIVGAAVELSGIGRQIGLAEAFLPPEVPARWAAMPTEGKVQVVLVPSEAMISAISNGLSGAEIALDRVGAVALVDGRVFALGGAAVRKLLNDLSWDVLPIEVLQMNAGLDYFAAPEPASLLWRAQKRTYLTLNGARDFVAGYPSFAAGVLGSAIVLMLMAFKEKATGVPKSVAMSANPAGRFEQVADPVRVVLVSDLKTLDNVRVAIGEEHLVAATEHSFAFADGWILASREGSVFELVNQIGWQSRPLLMATRAELVADGHQISPLPEPDNLPNTLGMLDALHVCGPLAHETEPALAGGGRMFG